MECDWRTLFIDNMKLLNFEDQKVLDMKTGTSYRSFWGPIMRFAFHIVDNKRCSNIFPIMTIFNGAKAEVEFHKQACLWVQEIPSDFNVGKLQRSMFSSPLGTNSYRFLARFSAWALQKSLGASANVKRERVFDSVDLVSVLENQINLLRSDRESLLNNNLDAATQCLQFEEKIQEYDQMVKKYQIDCQQYQEIIQQLDKKIEENVQLNPFHNDLQIEESRFSTYKHELSICLTKLSSQAFASLYKLIDKCNEKLPKDKIDEITRDSARLCECLNQFNLMHWNGNELQRQLDKLQMELMLDLKKIMISSKLDTSTFLNWSLNSSKNSIVHEDVVDFDVSIHAANVEDLVSPTASEIEETSPAETSIDLVENLMKKCHLNSPTPSTAGVADVSLLESISDEDEDEDRRFTQFLSTPQRKQIQNNSIYNHNDSDDLSFSRLHHNDLDIPLLSATLLSSSSSSSSCELIDVDAALNADNNDDLFTTVSR